VRFIIGEADFVMAIKPKRVRGYKELRPTQQLAARIEREVTLGKEGLVDPYAEHTRRPLSEHLADYLEFQRTRGRDDKYRYNLERRIQKVLSELAWTHFNDISAAEFESWMLEYMDREAVSGATVAQFLDSMRAFLNWCADPRRGRFPGNPLKHIDDLPHTATFRCRALTEEQIGLLLATVSADRARLYKFTLATGLRRQELTDLQWGDLVLEGPTPFVKLRAAATKSRRADTLPLRADVAQDLLKARPEGAAATQSVFSVLPSVDEFREDLRAAGVPRRWRTAPLA
jgi:integrase